MHRIQLLGEAGLGQRTVLARLQRLLTAVHDAFGEALGLELVDEVGGDARERRRSEELLEMPHRRLTRPPCAHVELGFGPRLVDVGQELAKRQLAFALDRALRIETKLLGDRGEVLFALELVDRQRESALAFLDASFPFSGGPLCYTALSPSATS
jgi:hypothetical protein